MCFCKLFSVLEFRTSRFVVPTLRKCPGTFLQQERFFLGRKTPVKFYNPGGGCSECGTPDSRTEKSFAETQMMVVRFDSVHTDSEFRKVWPGMAGKLVVSSIQIDLAFRGSRREDAASSASAESLKRKWGWYYRPLHTQGESAIRGNFSARGGWLAPAARLALTGNSVSDLA